MYVKELDKNKLLYKEMADVIGKHFSLIRSFIALCVANFM
jgi:hypothetical protein